jgi:hypothetical protein
MDKEITVQEKLLSLWPKSYDQKANRFRMQCIEKAADELAGEDWQKYNRIIDAVTSDNHAAFMREIQ